VGLQTHYTLWCNLYWLPVRQRNMSAAPCLKRPDIKHSPRCKAHAYRKGRMQNQGCMTTINNKVCWEAAPWTRSLTRNPRIGNKPPMERSWNTRGVLITVMGALLLAEEI
jgi:hypothetical protein